MARSSTAALPDRTVPRALRWARGMAWASVRYVFRRVPLYRRNRGAGDPPEAPDLHRELPGDPATVQRESDGVGPLFHRRYWIDVTDADVGPDELLGRVADDLNAVTDTGMSRFETRDGDRPGHLAVGSELVVRLPGPWDGPVRVVERGPSSFRLATLRGHMEAGEIEFRAGTTDRGFLRFEIESWARSGSPLFHLLYDRLPVARELQLHMWAQFCQRVAKLSGGIRMSNVQTHTERLADGSGDGR